MVRTCASERTAAAAEAVCGEKFRDRYVAMGCLMSRLVMACLHGTASIVLDTMSEPERNPTAYGSMPDWRIDVAEESSTDWIVGLREAVG